MICNFVKYIQQAMSLIHPRRLTHCEQTDKIFVTSIFNITCFLWYSSFKTHLNIPIQYCGLILEDIWQHFELWLMFLSNKLKITNCKVLQYIVNYQCDTCCISWKLYSLITSCGQRFEAPYVIKHLIEIPCLFLSYIMAT